MYPKQHIIYGAIFSIILFIIFPQIKIIGFLLIFFSSFLIDVDHYFLYISRKKDLNPIKAYSWHKDIDKKFLRLPRFIRNKVYLGVCFLHGVEIILFLILLSIMANKFLLFIAIGFMFHLSLDLVQQKIYYVDRPDKVSLLYDMIQSRRLAPLN